MARNDVAERLAEHPRLIGALFTASILLMNVGSALADGSGSTGGP